MWGLCPNLPEGDKTGRKMKKKKILIIFGLAGLLTSINFLNTHHNTWRFACITGQGPWEWWNFPMQIISNLLSKILLESPSCFETDSGLVCPTIFIGPGYCLILGATLFFFWFLVLVGGWWVIKRLLTGREK